MAQASDLIPGTNVSTVTCTSPWRSDDSDSYRLYPQHRWIYNKLLIAESQNFVCGPHGIVPDSFPVFSKPIYNLRGMGLETRIFHDRETYLDGRDPGHMWMRRSSRETT